MHFFDAFQSPAENFRHYWKKLIQIEKIAQNEKEERIKLSKYIITLTAVFIECFFPYSQIKTYSLLTDCMFLPCHVRVSHSIVAWMSRNSLLETGAKSEV